MHRCFQILSFVVAFSAFGLASTHGWGAEPDRPALVVVVSVDQWRFDYFGRFGQHLSSSGIAQRTQRDGAWFTNCLHQHAFTYTGPGHAVLLTGSYPNRTGIIDNGWYDRATGKTLYCVSDPDATLIGHSGDEDPVSPRLLLVDTLGDQMKLSSGGKSKVYGVAIKDRAAILMAGRLADGAFWMDYSGNWITSDHYGDSLPGFLRVLNEQQLPFRFADKIWDLARDPATYQNYPEQSDAERPMYGMVADFPHAMPAKDSANYIRQLACSPFGNDATLDAAKAIIRGARLGQDEYPDLLAINLSSTDYVGHAFGPYSLEVEDMTYRTDLQLGELVQFLAEHVGPNRGWVMFVTADHGVAPIPERAAKWGLVAARDPLGEEARQSGNIEAARVQLESHLQKVLPHVDPGLQRVEAVLKNQVFLSPQLDDALPRARELTRDWLLLSEHVTHAATRDQLLGPISDPMMQLIQRSFHPQRSGDVLYVLKPYAITGSSAATHGSPWMYDRHIPLMVLGSSTIETSDATSEVSPAAIAATVARMLQISPPSACLENALPLK